MCPKKIDSKEAMAKLRRRYVSAVNGIRWSDEFNEKNKHHRLLGIDAFNKVKVCKYRLKHYGIQPPKDYGLIELRGREEGAMNDATKTAILKDAFNRGEVMSPVDMFNRYRVQHNTAHRLIYRLRHDFGMVINKAKREHNGTTYYVYYKAKDGVTGSPLAEGKEVAYAS